MTDNKLNGITASKYKTLMSPTPPSRDEGDLSGRRVKRTFGKVARYIAGMVKLFFCRLANLIFGTHKWETDNKLAERLTHVQGLKKGTADYGAMQDLYGRLLIRLKPANAHLKTLQGMLHKAPGNGQEVKPDPLKGGKKQEQALEQPPKLQRISERYRRELNDNPAQPVGIKNHGNSCYMNSSLQVLLASPDLVRMIKTPIQPPPEPIKGLDTDEQFAGRMRVYAGDLKDHPKRERVRERLVKVVEAFVSREPQLMSDAAFLLRKEIFDSGLHDELRNGLTQQKDAASLLELALKSIGYHIDIRQNRRVPYNGEIHLKEEKANPLPMIQVPMSAREGNIQTLVNEAFRVEHINDISRAFELHLDSGMSKKVSEYTTQQRLKSCPDTIMVQLKRFNLDKKYNLFKVTTNVSLPNDTLDLSLAIDPQVLNGKSARYRLKGYVKHKGSLNGGHYIAQVKKEDNEWYHCNDSSTVKVNSSERDMKDAYILLLERIRE